ncbi:lytic murein transglycosylase [Candidatus Thioglobus sp.]|nr:lytic murein transglycosylase [Candidatus Thioglobus sp.]MDC0920450.1 lytic murein transglycosylase [Candidatus Thioglobus sp.]MDC0965669.1 lytic murein transglycosylase [Candidatus Thioglobus sp.]
MFRLILCLLFSSWAFANDTLAPKFVPESQSFEDFLLDIRQKAISRGVSTKTLDQVFLELTPNPKVIKFDQTQAEFSQNFWRYLGSRVSEYRLNKGDQKLKLHQQILQENYQKYGVPPHIIVAFWGLETNYGSNTGNLNLVRSLATLSYDRRRRDFFTEQLLTLLTLIDEHKIPPNAKGSWAGAMGNVQFMPTNVAAYGVDADQDGEIGLWDNTQDIFSSAAYFLQEIGWVRGQRWGREVSIPSTFDYQLATLSVKKTVNEWRTLGVKMADGKSLPNSTMKASLILPMGFKGPGFLVYPNFRAILRWNNSILYALSVGHLSDRLAGTDKLYAAPITEPSLSRENIMQIQAQLNQFGFDTGEPDGISGPKTRNAAREYQRANQLPIDGYVGYQLFQQLK